MPPNVGTNLNALKEALPSRRIFLKIAATAAAPAINRGLGFFSQATSESLGADAHADLIVTNGKVTNFGFMANAVWTTKEAGEAINQAA